MCNKIDFVVTWVDGNDEMWQKQKALYSSGTSGENDSIVRYRDWGLLRYWFRGVEKYAPWVNNIYFVTCGQIPEWLNTKHPKLMAVSHQEYMPATALPTYNSRAIEFCFHRIEGLSEQFVLFNDDMFLIDHVPPTLFFRNNLPCDYAALSVLFPTLDFHCTVVNDIVLINDNFSLRQCLRKHPLKWFSLKDIHSLLRTLYCCPFHRFSRIMVYHNALPYTKSEFSAMWDRYPDKLNATVHHRFRTNDDITHWLIRYWRLASGQFYPQSQRYSFYAGLGNEQKFTQAIDIISHQKKKEICLNDTYEGDAFEERKKRLQSAFETILPTPSSFEVD